MNIWFPKETVPKKVSTDPDSDYVKYWAKQMDRFQNGFTIANGYLKIHGWLYWHTAGFWKIERDVKMSNGKSFKGEGVPTFRDIEFEINEDLFRMEQEKKGMEWVGSRGFGKSVIITSIAGYYYTCFHNAEIAVTAASSSDLTVTCLKLKYGLNKLERRALRKKVLTADWEKAVVAGYKYDDGTESEESSLSRIMIRNFNEGENPMACNGLRPKFQLIDEIGKLPRLRKCYSDTQPCWMNDDGQFCFPILAGTGGDMNKGKDAKEMAYKPEAFNLLGFPDIWEGSKNAICKFTPVTKARNEYKVEMSLYTYLTSVLKRENVPDHEDLHRIKIKVSDEEACLREFVIPRRANAALDSDPETLLQEIAYYPIKLSEAFTELNVSKFKKEEINRHLRWVESEVSYTVVNLFRKGDIVCWEPSEDSPVMDWPVRETTNKKGAVVIYEFPKTDKPDLYTYVAGADPYNQDQSVYSTSLGAIYIGCRMTRPDNTFYDYIVAEYVGRPESMEKWNEIAEMLMDFYNAVCMPESEGYFVQYFDRKFKSHMLYDSVNFMRSNFPTSRTSETRVKGLPATPKVQSYCMNLLYEYNTEKIAIGKDEDTQQIIYGTGVQRIPSKMLLIEMLGYAPNKNVDRIVAFRHLVALFRILDKFTPRELLEQPTVQEQIQTEFRFDNYEDSPFIGDTLEAFSDLDNSWFTDSITNTVINPTEVDSF